MVKITASNRLPKNPYMAVTLTLERSEGEGSCPLVSDGREILQLRLRMTSWARKTLFQQPANRGQILPFGLMFIVVMLMMFFTVLNTAKLLQERVLLQNAADNAALSVAIIRARALNRIGYLVNQLPNASARAEISSVMTWYGSAVISAVDKVAKGQYLIGGFGGAPGGAEGYTIIGPSTLELIQEPVAGYVYQSGNFSNHKVQVEVWKTPGHPTMSGFPYGTGFLNLANWSGMTLRARAAAACYNVKGPMFPEGPVANIDAAQDYYCYDANSTAGDCNPDPASHAHKWVVSDAPTGPPYLDAHDGGWEAHLVKIGGTYAH